MTAPPAVPDVITVTGVSRRFGPRVLFRDVGFVVHRGEIMVILGGSGCGKSTMLRMLMGLLPPTEGRIEVLGGDMARADTALRRKVGVMFQMGALFGSMTLLQNVMLPLEMHTDLPEVARESVARTKLGLVGLGDAAGLMPAEISGGMAKRAAIARALAPQPLAFTIDKPARISLDRLILDLKRDLGISFVVVTHELASIMAIADRCIMLDKAAQGMIAEGDPRVLAESSTHPTVRAFFRRETAGEKP